MSDLIVRDVREWYFTMVDNPVIDDEELSKNALVVYVALCKFANVHTKECFPTYEKLCKTARMSNTPLSNALNELEQKGYIKRKRQPNKPVLYQIIGSLKTREPNPSGSLENGIPETREELEPLFINKKKDIYIVSSPEKDVFNHWNSQGIIQHRKLTDKMKRSINSALKDYSPEEITQAITNYTTILKGDEYYWNHRWTLQEFLQRGLEKFLDWEICSQNYRKREEQPKPMFTNIQM